MEMQDVEGSEGVRGVAADAEPEVAAHGVSGQGTRYDIVEFYCPACGHVQTGAVDDVNKDKCSKCGHYLDYENPDEALELIRSRDEV
jgi:Zn ribbon nucleic-acid-binding protein